MAQPAAAPATAGPDGEIEVAAEVDVLLTPREPGGHEQALFGWLADAVRHEGLRPRLRLPSGTLHAWAQRAGLGEFIDAEPIDTRRAALRALRDGRTDTARRPLLLAPGVLHAQAWLLVAALWAGRQVWLYVPMVFQAQGVGWRFGPWRDRLLAPWLARARGFITISDEAARDLVRLWQVPSRVLTLPNRVRLHGQAPPPPEPATDGRLRVAYVGRFSAHQKGLDWLAQALREDHSLRDACHWRFQGRGEDEPLLQALAAALGPQQVVVDAFAPLEQALSRCDLLVLPSRYEGLPLVALEATAQGWPVVASNRAGLADLLPAGSLFEFGDRAALRRALASLATPAARAAAVAHARARLRQHLPGERYDHARAQVVGALRS